MNETTNLKPYYFTFGSNEQFPYPNNYLVVPAVSEADAIKQYREKYPDATPGVVNCSFVYDKEQWVNGISAHYPNVPAEILGVPQKAIDYINAFCLEVHEDDADFSDLEEIGLFYSTVDDEEEYDYGIPIQNNANLIDKSIERYLGNILIEKITYDNDSEFLWRLENLEKSDLMYVTNEQFVAYHRTKALEYLEKTEKAVEKESAKTEAETSKENESNSRIFKASFDLDEMIKKALVTAGYKPTDYTTKEVLDCLYSNPFNWDGQTVLEHVFRAHLVKMVEDSISYLDEPEIQDSKGKVVH